MVSVNDGADAQPEPPIDALDEALQRACSLIPAGRYAIEILPREVYALTEAGVKGARFVVGIVNGEHKGKRIRLRLLIVAPANRAAICDRDTDILMRWRGGLGITERVADVCNLIARLGAAGVNHEVTLTLERRSWQSSTEMVITDVEVGGRRDG